jgi:hypothetical protein
MRFGNQRLVEYCEYIKDPLKLYFQEKIETLYLKKDVMRVIIEADNQRVGLEEPKKVEILSNSFLKFSEIQDIKESQLQKGSIRTIDRQANGLFDRMQTGEGEPINNYASTKLRKNLDLKLMMKVNDELIRNDPGNGTARNGSKFEEFVQNDSLVKDALNNQMSMITSKLQARKHNSMIKGPLIRKQFAVKTHRQSQS